MSFTSHLKKLIVWSIIMSMLVGIAPLPALTDAAANSNPFTAMYDSDEIFMDEVDSIIKHNMENTGNYTNSHQTRYKRNLLEAAKVNKLDESYETEISEIGRLMISNLYNDSRVDRFIVKYKNESKSRKLQNVVSYPAKDVYAISDKYALLNNDFNIQPNNESFDLECIVLSEKVNPAEFANQIISSGMAAEIEYIQPDYLMSYAIYDIENSNYDLLPYEDDIEDNVIPSQNNYQKESIKDYSILDTKDSTSNHILFIDDNIPNNEILTDQEPIIIALIDTGVDTSHIALSDSLIDGWNFLNNSAIVYDSSNPAQSTHGTHIAGIISSNVNTNVKIMPLAVFGDHGAYTSDIIEAILYAEDNGASIANCSFGSGKYNQALEEVIACSKMLFVASAGNARSDLGVAPVYPAAFTLDNVISVASLNEDQGFSYYSNYNNKLVDIAARGRDVYSALPGGEYGLLSGTSMAAGFVSAAAGAVISESDTLNAAALKHLLCNTGKRMAHLQNKVNDGRCLDAEQALSGTAQNNIIYIDPEDDFDVHGYAPTPEDSWALFSTKIVTQVAAGDYYNIVLCNDGTVWSWGNNSYGSLGNGTFTNTIYPVQVIGLTNIKKISSGLSHNIALKQDGTIWAWGDNCLGGIGDGTTIDRNVPVQVNGLINVKDIYAGHLCSFAVTNDNTIWAWGFNYYYNLCDGTTVTRLLPVQIHGIDNIVDISSGGTHTLAVKKDGTAWAWGSNMYGQLGDGTNINRNSPVQVNNISNVKSISAGNGHSIALKQDGSVMAWGKNYSGQIGDGTQIDRLSPVSVSGLTNVIKISAGNYHSIALKQDGSVISWGENNYGQIGDGTFSNKSTPINMSGINNVLNISTKTYHCLSVKQDGTIWTWGFNLFGQLGDGSYSNRNIPIQVHSSYFDLNVFNIDNYEYTQIPGELTGTASSIVLATPDEDFDAYIRISVPGKTANYSVYEDNVNKGVNVRNLPMKKGKTYKFDISAAQPPNEVSQYMLNIRPAASAEAWDEPIPSSDDKFKYIRFYDLTVGKNENDIIAESFYSKGVNKEYNRPFTPFTRKGQFEFTLQHSQYVRLVLKPDFSESEYVLAQNYYASGCEGDLNGAHMPFEFVTNVFPAAGDSPWNGPWDGTVEETVNGNVVRRYPGLYDANGKLIPGVYGFTLILEPLDPNTAKYKSFLYFTIDYTEEGTAKNELDMEGFCALDPVIVSNGNFKWEYTDFALYGKEPLEFRRSYRSLSAKDGDLGYGWRHNYLYEIEENWLFTYLWLPSGQKLYFKLDYDGSFRAPEGADMELEKTPSGYVLTKKDKTKYVFNNANQLTAIVKLNGETTTLAYTSGKLTGVSNRSGSLILQYSNDRIAAVKDTNSRHVIYSYDMSGNLSTVQNADGDTLIYSYDGHLLTQVKDFNDNIYLENAYDGIGRVVSQYLAGQGVSAVSYDTFNKTTIITDPYNVSTKYYFDGNNDIIKIEEHGGIFTEYEYKLRRLVSSKDKLGNITLYAYDNENNRLYNKYPDGTYEWFFYNSNNLVTDKYSRDWYFESYNYDIKGNMTSHTDKRDKITFYDYDAHNNLTKITAPMGIVTQYTYDAKGNRKSMTDAENNLTEYEYDALGRLIKKINPDLGTVEYTYSEAGKLLAVTDPDDNVILYSVNGNGYGEGYEDALGYDASTIYNEQNKPWIITDAEGNSVEYAYDLNGNMVLETGALGNETAYTYDEYNRMVSMTDARNNTWSYTYDAMGRTILTTDPYNNGNETIYDSMGRVKESRDARQISAISNASLTNITHGTLYDYDGMGRVIKTTDVYGKYSKNVYDANGNLIEQYDKRNNKWSYVYDSSNRMTLAKDPLGYNTVYEYDKLGRVTKTVTPLNAQNKNYYNCMGMLIKSVDAENNETDYEYDLLGRLVKTMYADGSFTQNFYNENGWLIKSRDRNGGIEKYAYNKNGQILTVTDAMNGVTTNAYDGLGRLVSVTDAMAGVTSHTYDENGNLLTTTDALGGVTEYTYDKMNRVKTITDPVGNATEYWYDETGNVSKTENPDGGEITYSYDYMGRLESYINEEGYQFFNTYDENGNITQQTDGRGNSVQKEYDKLNRVTKIIDEKGYFTTTEYDADGRLIRSKDAEGIITHYYYDKNGNLTSVKDALNNITKFAYDAMNRVSSMTDARNAVTAFTYTPSGSVETIADALNGVTHYYYDILGRLIQEDNELGKSTYYTYDALGRVLQVTDPLNHTDSFTYDMMGRIKTVTDKNGNVTEYFYDMNGNIVETMDALGHSSYFVYDGMDRLTAVRLYRNDAQDGVAGEEQITLYQYDKRGLLKKEINAQNKQTVYTYDGAGNMVSKSDADGYVTNYVYDLKNMVEAISYQGGKTVNFQYNKNGELVKMIDWNGATTFALDALNRISSVTDHNNKITSYTYDAANNKTSMVYPDSTTVFYEYDLLGRLTGVSEPDDTNTGKTDTAYTYDAASQLLLQQYPNGRKHEHEYDDAGRRVNTYEHDPTANPVKTLRFQYAYDSNGNLISNYGKGVGEGRVNENYNYMYDCLNRLVQVTGSPGNLLQTYTYDSLGNLTYEQTGNNKTVDYKHNNLNQMIAKYVDNHPNQYFTYTYDNRGNKISGTFHKNSNQTEIVESYIYDATNRMYMGMNADSEGSIYNYNGLGYLVKNEWVTAQNAYGYTGITIPQIEASVGESLTVTYDAPTPSIKTKKDKNPPLPPGGGSIQAIDYIEKNFVLDYTSSRKNVISETETGGLKYRYAYGLEKLSVTISPVNNGGGSYTQNNLIKLYYHMDRMGSVDYLSDNVQGKVASYIDYDAWGAPLKSLVLKLNARELDLAIEYTGHAYDSVLGLYITQARMYNPKDKRWLSPDKVKGSIGKPMTLVQYTYVADNPLKYVDPLGLMSLSKDNINNNYYSEQIIQLQKMLEYLGYLDMGTDINGAKQPYGIYGGRTSGAIRSFRFNYGYDSSSDYKLKDSMYLLIANVYVNTRYSGYTNAQREVIYNALIVNTLKKANMRFSIATGMPEIKYYKPFNPCIIHNGAALTQEQISSGVTLKTDYSSNGFVDRLDFTIPINNMIARNTNECFGHRFRSLDEYIEQWNDLSWFGKLFVDPSTYIDQYMEAKIATTIWFISVDGSGKEWDIKLERQFSQQVGEPWLGVHVDFYWGSELFNAEELGNFGFGYWASACGFSEQTIRSGSWLENFGDNLLTFKWETKENPRDIEHFLKGINKFYIDYPSMKAAG